jgi:IMP dehydrogenase/GMP reductase
MKVIAETKLDFNNVSIVPIPTDLSSRKEVDLGIYRSFTFLNSSKTWNGFPIISANMDSVSTFEMARALHKQKALCAIHKHYSVDELVKFYSEESEVALNSIFYTLGMNDADYQKYEQVKKSLGYDLPFICLDVANGYMRKFLDFIKKFKDNNPNSVVMAGNVVTDIGARNILEAGASIAKLGIGSGCLVAGTRILMADGSYQNIEDIKLHDWVINKNGKPVEVIGTKFSGYKKTKKIRSNLFFDYTYVTGDHKFWVGDHSTTKNIQKIGLGKTLDQPTKLKQSKFLWKSIESYDCNFILTMPKAIQFKLNKSFKIDMNDYIIDEENYNPQWDSLNKNIEPNYGLGFLFGSFLGDGHSSISKVNSFVHELVWSYGKHEIDNIELTQKYLKEVFNIDSSIYYRDNITQVKCRVFPLTKLFYKFGKRIEKHLPNEYRCSNKDYLQGLYDGLIASDGYCSKNEKDGREGLHNTSKAIIELFMFLSKYLNGYYPSIQNLKPSIGGLKNANIENCKPRYQARTVRQPDWYLTKDYQINRIWEFEDHEMELPTYDIEVDCDTHSFIANNAIVHNSACRTRIVAGVGIPQFSTILDTEKAIHDMGGLSCSDGGIIEICDVAKALGAGADFVMMGGMLAGHEESGGELFTDENGVQKKLFYGMSSETAMNKYNGGMASHRSSEGRTVAIDYKGPVENTVNEIKGGVRSAMTYTNSKNLEVFPKNVTFVKVNQVLNTSLAHKTTSH